MTRAVVYLRVSSEKQAAEQKSSLALQEQECRRYAERERWPVVEVCSDDVTGFETLNTRPGLQRVRALVVKREADAVIIWKIDRAARDQADLVILAREVWGAGGRFISATQGEVKNDAEGHLMLGIYGAFAEYERIVIRDRLHGNMRAQVAKGRIKPGPVPAYGYVWVGDSKEGYAINDEVAPIVRRIYQAIDDGMSLQSVAGMLNTEGIPTPSAYLAAQGMLSAKKQALVAPAWKRQTITYLVSNPIYAGRYVAYRHTTVKTRTGKRMPVVLDPSDERRIEQPGMVPAIVTPEQWERVQTAVRDRALGPVTRADQQTAPLLVKGIGVCGVCGGRVTVTKYGSDQRGYVCLHRKNRVAPGAEACPSGSWLLPTTEVDEAVWSQVAEMAQDTEAFQEMLAQPRRDAQAKLDEVNRREGAIRAELEQAQKDKETISSRMVRETDDTLHAIYRQQLQDVLRLISGLETRLTQAGQSEDKLQAYLAVFFAAAGISASGKVRLQIKTPPGTPPLTDEQLAHAIKHPAEYPGWTFTTLPPERTRQEKRTLLKAIGARVVMWGSKSDYARTHEGKRWELLIVPNAGNGSQLSATGTYTYADFQRAGARLRRQHQAQATRSDFNRERMGVR